MTCAAASTLIDQMRERFATLPGVRAVASSELPILTGTDMGGNITVEGGEKLPDEVNHVQTDSVSPGYFSTLGIPLVAGREFNAGDSTGAPKVAVINEAMAKKYFGQRNPIGMHAGVWRRKSRAGHGHRGHREERQAGSCAQRTGAIYFCAVCPARIALWHVFLRPHAAGSAAAGR